MTRARRKKEVVGSKVKLSETLKKGQPIDERESYRYSSSTMLRFVAVLCCFARIASSADGIIGDLIEVIDQKEQSSEEDVEIQPRFFPFSASFSLGKEGNAHTFSIAGGPDGIGLSQSNTHSAGGLSPGEPGYSSSQSSSLTAGLNGIAASDSNAFASNHPVFGQTAHADGNAFSLGDAAASAHGDVINGQATSGAQSSVGSTNSQASSLANGPNSHRNPGQYRPYNPYPQQQGWSPVVDYPPRPYPSQQPWSTRPSYYDQPRPTNQYWADAPPSYASGSPGNYYNSNRKPSLTVTVSDDQPRNGISRPAGWYPSREGHSRENWNHPDYPSHNYPSNDPCNQYNGYRDPRCRGPRVVISKPDHGVNGGGTPVINVPLSIHEGHRRPSGLHFEEGPFRGPYFARDPRESSASQLDEAVVVSDAGVSSVVETDGSDGPSFASGHSHSEATHGSDGPSSLTITQVDVTGKGQANAHGSSSSSQQRPDGLQVSLSSGSSSANSLPGGSSHGSSLSQSSKGNSKSEAKGSSSQIGGTSHKSPSGIVVIPFEDPELEPRDEPHSNNQIIPQEFIRSAKPSSTAAASATATASATESKPIVETSSKKKKMSSNKRGSKSEDGPIVGFLSDVSDSISDFIDDLV